MCGPLPDLVRLILSWTFKFQTYAIACYTRTINPTLKLELQTLGVNLEFRVH